MTTYKYCKNLKQSHCEIDGHRCHLEEFVVDDKIPVTCYKMNKKEGVEDEEVIN